MGISQGVRQTPCLFVVALALYTEAHRSTRAFVCVNIPIEVYSRDVFLQVQFKRNNSTSRSISVCVCPDAAPGLVQYRALACWLDTGLRDDIHVYHHYLNHEWAGFVRWMEAHRSEYTTTDSTRSLSLSQHISGMGLVNILIKLQTIFESCCIYVLW